jgi:hypothetical protein
MMATKTLTIPSGASRTYPFSIKMNGVNIDLTGWAATVVVKNAEGDSASLYSADCPPSGTDSTVRLVTIEGAATDLAAGVRDTYRPACVHVVSPDGKPDTYELQIKIERHA